MIESVESVLNKIGSEFLTLNRNTMKGWHELEIGIPPDWIFRENKNIGCEIILDIEKGKIIRIFPKKMGIIVDDLISFVMIIAETNNRIAEKELEFTNKMNEEKERLEIEAKSFYNELHDLRESSFEGFNEKTESAINNKDDKEESKEESKEEPKREPKPKKKRGRPVKQIV